MKNLIIGLFLIGLTTLGFSQQKKGKIKAVQLKDVTVNTTLSDISLLNFNFSYLDKVQDNTTAAPVKSFQAYASRYDIMNLSEFDGRQELFQVMFKGTKGYIVAYYNNEGKILSTNERYRDIKIPKKMVRHILSEYPDSKFLKMVHTVHFKENNDVKKIYRIRILNDNSKKNLKITTTGDNDNSYAMTIEK